MSNVSPNFAYSVVISHWNYFHVEPNYQKNDYNLYAQFPRHASFLQGSLHSKKKNTSEHLFWCFRLSQIEDSIYYLEDPQYEY